jgi:predicted deacylase
MTRRTRRRLRFGRGRCLDEAGRTTAERHGRGWRRARQHAWRLGIAGLCLLWVLGSSQAADDLRAVGPVEESPAAWGAMQILGEQIGPGEKREIVFFTSESFQALSVKSPVVVIRGAQPGPTFCMTAAVHGDELNGVEIVRQVVEGTRPADLRGTVIGVPIVNMLGFERSSRYLPDRRDLNRYFPGQATGSSASRIAHAFFEAIVRRCDALVDLHTGSLHRANLPQIRADLLNPRVATLAKAFGAGVIVHHVGGLGTLRRAATDAGIPTIIYEGGEPMRFQEDEIKRGAAGIRNLLIALGLRDGTQAPPGPQSIFYDAHWVRVDNGGILVSDVGLGDWVEEGKVLGAITDPMGRDRSQIFSPYRGRIIGVALAPVVIPGVAAYHIGLERPLRGGTGETPPPEYVEPEDERPE